MKIQVHCRDGEEPDSFYLGGRKLHVLRVLERDAEDSKRRIRVRVVDGREFVLQQDRTSGEWTLTRVNRHKS